MPDTYKVDFQKDDILHRLTALWAFSESGIGGFMFAFKIPLTGLLLGANAIILLTLISFYAKQKFSQIVRATILVLIVKILVSPHSSPAAYLAVGFQGLLAAVLFSKIKSIKLAAILLGTLSMIESALQKLLLLTIVFGTAFWEAINKFFQHLSGEFSLNLSTDYSYWIITIYLLLFSIWGMMVGQFAAAFPTIIITKSQTILQQYQLHFKDTVILEDALKSRRRRMLKMFSIWLIPVSILLLLSFYFPSKAWWLLGRTTLILIIFYLILIPLFRWSTQRWLAKRQSKDVGAARQMIEFLPQVKKYFSAAYRMAAKENSYLKRLKSFITNVVIITLYAEHPKHNNI